MLGIVDAGGGVRGIYGAGVLDYCLEQGVKFDYCIGVSAGSANLLSYIAGRRGCNFNYFLERAFNKKYMSFRNLLRTGSFFNIDNIFSNLFDYEAVKASGMKLRIVTTSAKTGKPVYFTEKDLTQNNYDVIKASCSLPFVNRPYIIKGEPYYDGGISDPIPVEKAFQDGCDRVIITLTKPNAVYKDGFREKLFAHFIKKKFPKAAELTLHRNALYMSELNSALKYACEGRALIISPKTVYNLTMLKGNKTILKKLYDDAMRDAQAINNFIK